MTKRISLKTNEIWIDIKGYEGLYQVSSLGRVKSLTRIIKHSEGFLRTIKGRIIKLQQNNFRSGYYEVSLHKDGTEKRFRINVLVAKSFIPNPENKPQVNHKNGDKSDNSVDNLEWSTDIENKRHGWENGLYTNNHRKKKIICNETEEEYESVTDASRKIPCDRKYLTLHLNGKNKAVKGNTYSYYYEEEYDVEDSEQII